MNKFNEDHLQIYIDELIDNGLDHSCRPDWMDCEEFRTSVSYELVDLSLHDHVFPVDILQELWGVCTARNELDDIDMIKLARSIIEESNNKEYDDFVAIFELENTNKETFYTSIFFSADCIPMSPSYTAHDRYIKSHKSLDVLKNDLILKLRPMTTKPDGSPLSDREILSLWDEVFT